MFGENCKFSDRCKVQGQSGLIQLDRIGVYVVITNKTLFEEGASHRFTIVNESEKWVDSVHGSHRSALKHVRRLLGIK